MANEFYISAGLVPNDSGETNAANTFYISAGLVPDDLEEEPPAGTWPPNRVFNGPFFGPFTGAL
jgi:hypothetical protein